MVVVASVRQCKRLRRSMTDERRQLCVCMFFLASPDPCAYATNLSISYLVLHLPRLLRRPTEQENAAGQPVQPMNGPEILQVVLLRQDEDHGVVPVTTAWMHLRTQAGQTIILFSRHALSLMLKALRENDLIQEYVVRISEKESEYVVQILEKEKSRPLHSFVLSSRLAFSVSR